MQHWWVLATSILVGNFAPVTLWTSAVALIVLDFILGTVRALIAHNWRYRADPGSVDKSNSLQGGVQKVMLSMVCAVLASFMVYPYNNDFDHILKTLGAFLGITIIMTEFTSCLRNTRTISLLLGIPMPFMSALIDRLERMEGRFVKGDEKP